MDFPRRRGRPPKGEEGRSDTRAALLRAGLEALTEKGFAATGIDEILRRVAVPKGSFYHYFASKEAFGAALIAQYGSYFAHKLERWFGDRGRAPLDRLRAFADDAREGMARHGFRRGCLVGNLGQELEALPESFRGLLAEVFADWQGRLAACLEEAREAGAIAPDADCGRLASVFWTGWEGAVLRARLERRGDPLDAFVDFYCAAVAAR